MTTTPVRRKTTSQEMTVIQNPRRLTVIRAFWIVAAIIITLIDVAGLIRYADTLNSASNRTVSSFVAWGLPVEVGIVYVLLLTLLMVVVFTALAGLLFHFKGNDWMALHSGLTLIAMAAFYSRLSTYALEPISPALPDLFFAFSVGMIMSLVLLFPDGRFNPRWTPLLVIAFPLYVLLTRESLMHVIHTTPLINAALHLAFIGAGVLVLIYRHRTEFNSLQKAQVTSLLYPAAGVLAAYIVLDVLQSIGWFDRPRFALFFETAVVVVMLVIPVVTVFSIMRYRLYNIHLALNRSIVYGSATGGLGFFFLFVAILIQSVLGDINAPVTAAIILMGVGAFFNPTRKRLQNFIDRKIYGFRFDLMEVARGQQRSSEQTGILTGKRLGEYKLLDVIGKGGMGEVYRGIDRFGQMVAVKVLRDELAKEEEFRARFTGEARTLIRLDHPHIVKVYDMGEDAGKYYMVMEFVEGRDLGQIIKQRGCIELEDMYPFLMNFAAALDYAHGMGFVHRDIKPANIMLRLQEDNENYEAILMDFGVAKIQDEQERYTGTNAVGTIEYMAPEQIMESRTVDHRADIYALGVVLYEILTGERPYKGASGQVLFAHLQQPIPDPNVIKTDLPRHIAKAIMKAMEKEAKDRFQSACELAEELYRDQQQSETLPTN